MELGRSQIKLWRMCVACWINKAIHTHTHTHTHTHSDSVILIAFPLQTWLQERSCMCHCVYIDCLVYIFVPRGDWIDVAQNSVQQYAVKITAVVLHVA